MKKEKKKEEKKDLAICWLEGGIGAVVASTALVSTIADMYNKVVVCTSHPDVFANNENVAELYSFEDGGLVYNKYLCNQKVDIFRNQYMHYRPTISEEHIVALQHKFNGIKWDGRLPILKSDPHAGAKFDSAFVGKKNVVIHINGSTSTFNPGEKWNFNKEVAIRHWNAVTKACSDSGANVIQVGLPSEYLIPNALDLRGKTTLHEMIAVIDRSDMIVSIESCVAHIAGALGKSGVVFYTATSPKAFGYKTLTPIEPTSNCRYCGRPDTFYGDMVKQNGKSIPWQCRTRDCVKSIDDKVVYDSVLDALSKCKEK